MVNFTFRMPTRVVFGKDAELETAQQILACGGKRVLLHYGGSSAKKSGLLDRITGLLDKAGIPYCALGGVVPNPRLSLVREGIALCKKENLDFILAVGGGSVIDSAKAIGIGIANPEDVWDFYMGRAEPKACAPVGVVLTIAAAGSETSTGSVITNEEGPYKRACDHELLKPVFAAMNPELLYTLPSYQISCGGVDILMHTMERYFTPTSNVELSDGFCESLMRTVMHNLPVLLETPDDYNACAEIMWAGSICHNGILGCGRDEDWATHNIEHEVSAIFDVAHGAGLAAVWGSWARYVCKTNPGRFAQLAVNVMGCVNDFQNPERTALEGIAAMERFFHRINMPTSLSELGCQVTDENIRDMAKKAVLLGNLGGFQSLGEQDVVKIYQMAK